MTYTSFANMAKFKFRAVNLHKSAHFRLFSFVALRVFATLWHFSFLDFVSFSLDFAPTMATIIKRGSKRKLTDVSERESKMKIRRKVYLEVEKIKAEGKTRGIYSIVARQLVITDDHCQHKQQASKATGHHGDVFYQQTFKLLCQHVVHYCFQ